MTNRFKRLKNIPIIACIMLCIGVLSLGLCSCRAHAHAYYENVATEFIKIKATCTEKAIYYKSCICGKKSSETFEAGEAIGHDYKIITANDDGTHTKTCANDASHTITEDCHGGVATCSEQARCEECGNYYGTTVPHNYTYMSSSETEHWLACVCGAKSNVEKHTPSAPATETTDQVCTTCLYVIEHALGHMHVNHLTKEEEISPTCTQEGVREYYVCSCGLWFKNADATEEIVDEEDIVLEKIDHEFDQKNTDEQYLVCKATNTDRAKYYMSCTCGKTGEEFFEFGCPLYHYLNENGECIYCLKKDYFCEHAALKEFFLSEDAPIERCGIFECENCGKTFCKTIGYSDVKIPVVCLDGNISNATKTNKETVTFSYYGEKNYTGKGTVKLQGSSSIWYPKKNYTLKLESKIKIKDSWGKQKKYCLKANYVDYSQARNVVSAKLYGQIVKSRNIDDEISSLVNGGAIDGFPVLVFSGGNYLGLYTFNIPKDKWLFGMSDSDEKKQAILMGDNWSESVSLNEYINEDFSNGWELEYYSNEDSKLDSDNSWVVDGFNEMMRFLFENDGDSFKEGIGTYIAVERSIDAMLFTFAMCALDNTSKNILWITYDGGKTWQPSVYDMDDSWGLIYDGTIGYSPDSMLFDSYAYNLLWKRLFENYRDEIVERWRELRSGILTTENVTKVFADFIGGIPSVIYDTEKIKWTDVPSKETNNLEQITKWCEKHLDALDKSLLQ